MPPTAEQYFRIATVYDKVAADQKVPAPQRAAFARKAEWFRMLAQIGAKKQSAASKKERPHGARREDVRPLVQKARERLQRAIKKAWLVRSPGLPQPTIDPNVPLRIQLTRLPGLRIEGRAWLDNPVLQWEASEIECLCRPWTPSSQALSSAATQAQARIEVWGDDLVRLWGGDNTVSQSALEANETLSG
jgi:hypothetical protein